MELSFTEQNSVTIITLKGNVMGGPDASSLNDKLHEIIESGKSRSLLTLQVYKS